MRMKPEDAAEIRELSGYEPDTAGGIMTPDYVAVAKDATSAQAIAAIRRLVDEAETVNYVYVVDDERHLLGVLSLYRLLLSPDDTPVVAAHGAVDRARARPPPTRRPRPGS